MSISLTAITNSNTFGQWKDQTNLIISGLNKVVTIGDSEVNAGNVKIGGNITGSGTLFVNTIDTTLSSTDNIISLNADLKVTGTLRLNNVNATEIIFSKAASETWTIGTSVSHTQFDIKKGTSVLSITDPAAVNAPALLSGTNLKLSPTLFPASLGVDITGKAAKADEWTTGRTIQLTGDVTGTSAAWKGDGNISFETTVADNSHSHTVSNITDFTTELNKKLSLSGGTMTGALKISDNTGLEVGTTSGKITAIKRGTFGTAVGTSGHVADAFSITTSGTNVSTYLSLPGAGSSFYIANGVDPKVSVAANGDIVTVGDITAFGSISDINKKENIVRIPNALDKVKQVSGYTYNYIGDPTSMTGVVAQEFENILPEVVYDVVLMDGTVSKAVRHGNIVGLLIEAIKELEAQIKELKDTK